jgi:Sulfatase/C-terminal region of aryl-sulfatase
MIGEVDWAVGAILQYLRDLNLDENTLVVLSSDNGPFMESASSYCPQNCRWATPEAAKSGVPDNFGCTPCAADTVSLPGPHTGGKGNTWEGGQRVPSIWWWPGAIPAGTVNPIVASGLDLLPTFVALAGGDTDADIALDGRDISFSILSKTDPAAEPEGSFVYWCGLQVNAVRTGKHKTIWFSQDFVTSRPDLKTPLYLCGQTGKCCPGSPSRLCTCLWGTKHDPPLVIDLSTNPNEDFENALDSSNTATKEIVAGASAIRLRTVQSVLQDRNLPTSQNVTEMLSLLEATPNYPQVDLCLAEGVSLPLGPYVCNGTEFPRPS